MSFRRRFGIACVATVSLMQGTAAGQSVLGTLIASGDEWIVSNDAFTRNPASTTALALNIGAALANGQAGANFLVYSDNFGLRGSSLASTMTGAGYGWDVSATLTLDLPTLQAYDAVLLSGELGRTPADIAVLQQYLTEGGSVLVLGGTSGTGASIAAAWNPLLALGGLAFDPDKFPGSFVAEFAVNPGDSTLDDGVSQITWGNGQNVFGVMSFGDSEFTQFVTADFTSEGLTSTEPIIGIYQIPAPGGAVVMGLALISATRRRR